MKAEELFKKGYNCAQAVVCAFADKLKLPEKELFRLAYGFGGGFSREREVCGAVSGMVIVADILFAPSSSDHEEKSKHYALIRELIEEFRERAGNIRCARLLGINSRSGEPEKRSQVYYEKRPCARLCAIAENILTKKIKETENE